MILLPFRRTAFGRTSFSPQNGWFTSRFPSKPGTEPKQRRAPCFSHFVFPSHPFGQFRPTRDSRGDLLLDICLELRSREVQQAGGDLRLESNVDPWLINREVSCLDLLGIVLQGLQPN